MVALFCQTGLGGECRRRHHIINNVGYLCISMMCLLNFFLVETTLKQELYREGDMWQKGQGKMLPSCPPPPPSCPAYHPHTSSSSRTPPNHHHTPTYPPHPLHSPPPVLQKPVGQALGCLHKAWSPHSQRFKKVTK